MLETLFDSRTKYFDGVGTKMEGNVDTKTALQRSGLDYTVEKKLLYTSIGGKKIRIPDKYATVRSDNNQVLGVVGKDYCVLNNQEGFDFIDDLVGEEGAQIETAGSWDNGRRALIVAKTPAVEICGDEISPYILFTNSHDGSGSIKAMFTPVRVVCDNALLLAEREAEMKISIRHSKNAKDRLMIAKEVLMSNHRYVDSIRQTADIMNNTALSKDDFLKVVKELLGMNGELSNIRRERAELAYAEISQRYDAPDLRKFDETVWRSVQCISDHESPLRNTGSAEIQLNRVMAGMLMLNQFIQLLAKKRRIRL